MSLSVTLHFFDCWNDELFRARTLGLIRRGSRRDTSYLLHDRDRNLLELRYRFRSQTRCFLHA